MDANKPKFYITTAIPYASQKPHIGNTYEIIMTDAVARYKRLRGYDVYFQTGADEHGLKIEEKAEAAGISPKEYADRVSGELRGIWDLMGASYDRFIRTTDADHMRAVSHIFDRLYAQGDIYKSEYEGWYCTPDESFYTDTQVVDGKCPDCGRPVQRMKEEAYSFRMSKYAPRLMEYIDAHPDFIQPEARKREMVNNFLKPGLRDLCVTRTSFKWGIPVSFDPRHVIYVWIDALSNYITGLGYDPTLSEQPELFRRYWPADVHIIGKDILRFHTIYWPIMLMALGLPLPERVFGHPWFNFGEEKMSKSRGNVIYADDLVKRFGVDGVRHYVLAEMPYLQDGSVTYEALIKRYNADLANNLGNLVNRTVAMTHKYFGGEVPAPQGEEDALDADLRNTAAASVKAYFDEMDSYHVADAVETAFAMLRRANKYIDETSPWSLAKSEDSRARLSRVIYNLLETIRIGAALVTPFMPGTSDAILAQLGTSDRSYEFGRLVPGTKVGQPVPLFARLDGPKLLGEIEAEKQAKAEKAAAEAAKPAAAAVPAAKKQMPVISPEIPTATTAPAIQAVPVVPEDGRISIDDFMKCELRTAQVIAAEPVPKSKKLLKLTLDLGTEHRTVASGIAKFYKPEDLIGKKVIIVANLRPAVLCGVESNGMILAASGKAPDGAEDLHVIFLSDDVPLGERVR